MLNQRKTLVKMKIVQYCNTLSFVYSIKSADPILSEGQN